MRTIFKSIIIASILCIAGNTASAQTLKDILDKAANNSTVTEIVEKVTGVNISKGDIKGTWNYTGSAVKLESENILKAAAAGAAAGAAFGAGAATGALAFFLVGSIIWRTLIIAPKAINTPNTMVMLIRAINQGLVVTGPIYFTSSLLLN